MALLGYRTWLELNLVNDWPVVYRIQVLNLRARKKTETCTNHVNACARTPNPFFTTHILHPSTPILSREPGRSRRLGVGRTSESERSMNAMRQW